MELVCHWRREVSHATGLWVSGDAVTSIFLDLVRVIVTLHRPDAILAQACGASASRGFLFMVAILPVLRPPRCFSRRRLAVLRTRLLLQDRRRRLAAVRRRQLYADILRWERMCQPSEEQVAWEA